MGAGLCCCYNGRCECNCCRMFKCFNCCTNASYLHVFIESISDLKPHSDFNISGSNDVYITAEYSGIKQQTTVHRGEHQSVVFNEPVILKNARPDEDIKLRLFIMDKDMTSRDDKLGVAEVELIADYNRQAHFDHVPIMYHGQQVGNIKISHVYFVKSSKLRYQGPCSCLCCCLN